jgi:hypothetical protein
MGYSSNTNQMEEPISFKDRPPHGKDVVLYPQEK